MSRVTRDRPGELTLRKHMAIVSLLWAGISLAQEPDSIPRPCLEKPELGHFDFWLGEWDVHMEDGLNAGVNSITKEQGGCVLIERWTSVRGGSGISLNYFDDGRVRQHFEESKDDGETWSVWFTGYYSRQSEIAQ